MFLLIFVIILRGKKRQETIAEEQENNCLTEGKTSKNKENNPLTFVYLTGGKIVVLLPYNKAF
jgi:hypothetical protein